MRYPSVNRETIRLLLFLGVVMAFDIFRIAFIYGDSYKSRMAKTTLVGRRLREERQAKAWTQAEVALRAGLSQAYVSQIENGERKNPGILQISALEDALGLPRGTLNTRKGTRGSIATARNSASAQATRHVSR